MNHDEPPYEKVENRDAGKLQSGCALLSFAGDFHLVHHHNNTFSLTAIWHNNKRGAGGIYYEYPEIRPVPSNPPKSPFSKGDLKAVP